MCGICGAVSWTSPVRREALTGMARALAHRGPDGDGFYVEGPVGLGHRRLKIIDLSDAAAEPMTNEDGTLWLVFNGEISSAVPTFLLSELTRSQVTVALNGDGGDEVFAGYLRLYGGVVSERVPRWAFASALAALRLLPEPADRRHPLRFAKRFAEAGRLPLVERYLRWNAYFPADLAGHLRPELAPYCGRERILASFVASLGRPGATLARLLQVNFDTYLLDDLLVKMDRMSMAHGLEARSPFLDTAVVEFGAGLPDRLRIRWGRGKRILRQAMKGLLPQAILDRKKMGFGAPLGAWFRSDLHGFVKERLLDPASPLYEYLRPEPVASLVGDHMRAAADLSPQIWALLTLESWLRQEAAR